MRSRVLAFLVIAALMPAAAAARGPLETAIFDPPEFSGPQGGLAFARVRSAGATKVRLILQWDGVAPSDRPADFVPTNPDDPRYNWSSFDRLVGGAIRAGLQPIANVVGVPRFAQREHREVALGLGGRPDPDALAAFMRAAARRYSGGDPAHPRIRYWQIWNEPNITPYLSPQFRGKRPVAAAYYRAMLNGAARAIHEVRADNVVVAGALSPFTADYGSVESVGPLRFMRDLLCLSSGPKPRPTCSTRVEFDVWAHHPYTSGGPTHQAAHADDVSLGDLGEMRALLDAARRAGRIRAPRSVGFWVTEFSWDSKSADPRGVPEVLRARWVSEALHEMWKAGVTVATWFKLRDEPFPSTPYQSGLYARGATPAQDRPRPSLAAFRFPFVAYLGSKGVLVWGRTPGGKPARIVIEHKSIGGGWRRVALLRTDRYGIVQGRLALPRSTKRDVIRARVAGGNIAALPFSLQPQPDRVYNAFGT